MARRSIFVAIAALAAALVPAAAQAATPGRTSNMFASPVTFSWTPDPLVLTEQLLRARVPARGRPGARWRPAPTACR